MNIQQIAETIQFPLNRWAGNCYYVATAIVKAKIYEGRAVYGHYHGFIHPKSIFGGRPFTHHGWIVGKTQLVDPTRWCFECVRPYIYTGPKDDENYDAGSNRLKKMLLKPAPPFDPKHKTYKVASHLQPFVATMLGDDRAEISVAQLLWLGCLPLDMLGEMTEPLYRWIAEDCEYPAAIPFDNRLEVLGK